MGQKPHKEEKRSGEAWQTKSAKHEPNQGAQPLAHADSKLEILVRRAKAGDQSAYASIIEELEPELRMLASNFFVLGGEKQDIIQEGRIGIFKAVEDYREGAGMNFKNFAIGICARRQMYTAINRSRADKYFPLNSAESLDRPVLMDDDDNRQTFGDLIVDHAPSPLELLLSKEEFETNTHKLRQGLTDLERMVHDTYCNDKTYKEIADDLSIKPKAADNALIRIRRKGALIYSEYTTDGETPSGGVDIKKKKRRVKQ